MGYNTKFFGRFNLSRKLTTDEYKELTSYISQSFDQAEASGVVPGMWCDWRVTSDRMGIHWNGREKFYHYVEWLQLIIDDFLFDWGVRVEGSVAYIGDGLFDDLGTLCVENSAITVKKGVIDLTAVTTTSPVQDRK